MSASPLAAPGSRDLARPALLLNGDRGMRRDRGALEVRERGTPIRIAVTACCSRSVSWSLADGAAHTRSLKRAAAAEQPTCESRSSRGTGERATRCSRWVPSCWISPPRRQPTLSPATSAVKGRATGGAARDLDGIHAARRRRVSAQRISDGRCARDPALFATAVVHFRDVGRAGNAGRRASPDDGLAQESIHVTSAGLPQRDNPLGRDRRRS